MTQEINPELVNKIRKDLIEETYYQDIKYNLGSRTRWKITADVTETISQVLTGITTILAFSAGFFTINYLLNCL